MSHDDFLTIINEERNYLESIESIRMINSQRSDTGKIPLIEKGKKIGINKAIKHNEFINDSLISRILNNVILLFKVHKKYKKHKSKSFKQCNGKTMISKCAICGSKKSRFI